jgi:hypothetical protein
MTLFRDPLSEKLTHEPLLKRQALATHPGMAHFAGTGPDNMTCRQCLHWAHHAYDYRSKTGKYHGLIKPAPCRKYKAITGKEGDDVPDDAPSCKYFEWNVAHPRRFAKND